MKCPTCSTPLIMVCPGCLGRLGGAKTSTRKTAAARKNAKLGGWPKGRPRGKKKPNPAD